MKAEQGKRYNIILSGDIKNPLEELAKQTGYLWGEKGNVQALVKAIAQHQIPLTKSPTNKQLPKVSCVYFGMNNSWQVVYVGKTVNLAKLHSSPIAQKLIEGGVSGLSWMEVERNKLDHIYQSVVGLLNPPLNQSLTDQIPSRTAPREVEHLTQAFWTLRDTGQVEAANTIAKILLEEYEISPALEQHLMSLPRNNQFPNITQAIAQKTPFILSYQSASGKDYSFEIMYGEIRQIERHYYLCCWVSQPTGKGEIDNLAHNLTLRLDRIKDAVILPVPEMQWRNQGLDSVILEMKFTGGWTKAYEPKADDISVVRRDADIIVQRRLEFWHWTKREILRYGADCEVIGPSEIRELMQQEIAKIYQNYETI